MPLFNLKELKARGAEGIRDLEQRIKKASDAYYNTGKSIITDAEFDNLVELLRKLKPNSKVLTQIGAPVRAGKVELPFHMGSLDKIKPESADSWLESTPGPYVVSDKLDGVSIGFVFGTAAKAYTRGNGTVGQDISHLVPFLDVPAVKKRIKARGEIIMSRSEFEHFSDEFENARNLVSGLVNRKDIHRAIHSVTVVFYELIEPRMSPSEGLALMKSLGLKVVPHKVIPKLSASSLNSILTKRKSLSKFDMDGLVVVVDKKQPVNTGGNPVSARAFKALAESDIATVRVLGVEWEASKHGYLKPRVNIEPTRLSGVTVSYATGFNAKYVQENGIGRGALIRITRSGDVIPHILETVKAVKPSMPPASFGSTHWTKNGVDLVMDDLSAGDAGSTVRVKRILNFFSTLGAEFIGAGVVRKLVDAGHDSVPKILKLKKAQLLKIEGFQDRSAQKVIDSIGSAIQDVELHTLMDASGLFGRLLGSRKLGTVVAKYPSLEQIKELDTDAVASLSGWSTSSAQQFVDSVPEFVKWLKACPSITWTVPEPKRKIRGKLSGQGFVFTGVRDAELQQKLESLGAEVTDSVRANTTVVVAKDPNGNSTKLVSARTKGLKIMSLDAARRLYLR
jgi:NAD-dependent DNA ligase